MQAKIERIMTVGHFMYSRALLLQALLQAEGVECFIVNRESVQLGGEVDLRVKESDLVKAMKVINSSLSDSGEEKYRAFRSIQSVRRILVPIDFSNASVNASRFAIGLAYKYKAEVRLIHVFYNPAIDITPYNDHYAYQIRLINSLREIEKNARENILKYENKLKSWAEREGYRDVKINATLANGHSIEEILAFSKKYRPAVIVMAGRGLSKPGKREFGRITTSIMEKSGFPVIALPEKNIPRIEYFTNLLYATDFDNADFSVLNRLISMMTPFGITIHCLHISVGTKKPWVDLKMDELRNYVETQYSGAKIKFSSLVSDDLIIGIELYIRNNNIDIVAATTHKRQIFERLFSPSITKKIFSVTNKPVLVFHAKA